MQEIVAQLETLGLEHKEAAVYAALLGMKKGTALSVAEAAGIKRPTAYLVLEALRAKRLVAVTKFRNVKDYRALPIEHLKNYITKQKRLMLRELPAIQKMYNERKVKVRLRVYHTLSDVKVLFEKSLREKQAVSILGNEAELIRELGGYWHFYSKRAGQLNIAPQFKHCPGPVTLLLWSDKVAFVSFENKVQVFGFKNKQLHDLYRALYSSFTSSLSPLRGERERGMQGRGVYPHPASP